MKEVQTFGMHARVVSMSVKLKLVTQVICEISKLQLFNCSCEPVGIWRENTNERFFCAAAGNEAILH